jgi:hypothetical protein
MGGGTTTVSPRDSSTSLGRKERILISEEQNALQNKTLHVCLDTADVVIDGMTGFKLV